VPFRPVPRYARAILGSGRIALIVLNPHGGGDRTVSTFANRYDLPSTIEHEWHLGCLAAACGIGRSQLLTPLFTR
jgi:hypothetical protein